MEEIIYEVEDSVAVVTLNRPDHLNALSASMHERLEEVWAKIKRDARVKAILVAGNGRGFCVGMDLKQFKDRGGYRPSRSDRIADVQQELCLGSVRPSLCDQLTSLVEQALQNV